MTVVGMLFVVFALGALVIRSVSFRSNPLLAVAAFTPYLMVGAPIGLIVLLAARAWLPSAAGIAVLALCVLAQAPLFIADTARADSVPLRMMTANLRLGEADPQALVRLVRDQEIDVLTVQELTEEEVVRLRAAGLDSTLPYSALAARGGADGVGIWSRHRLLQQTSPTGLRFQIVVVRVEIPDVAPPTVVATHMTGPWPGPPTLWSSDMTRLPSILAQLSRNAGTASVLVGGDFNATPDTAQFRSLLTGGFQDGAAQAGAGLTRTYPSDTWYPPLIAIDHVLTCNAVATSAATFTVPRSDHRALVTSIALPRQGV